jgi:hypothetical protein
MLPLLPVGAHRAIAASDPSTPCQGDRKFTHHKKSCILLWCIRHKNKTLKLRVKVISLRLFNQKKKKKGRIWLKTEWFIDTNVYTRNQCCSTGTIQINLFYVFIYLLISELGFELRASSLPGRCSITWALLPALFVLVIFDNRVSHFS